MRLPVQQLVWIGAAALGLGCSDRDPTLTTGPTLVTTPADDTTNDAPTTSGDASTTSTDANSTAASTTAGPTDDTTTTASTTAGPTDATTTAADATTAPATDLELCEAFCAMFEMTVCGEGGPCGVETCVDTIHYADTLGCGDLMRSARACEGAHPLDYGCVESSACAAEYLLLDVCMEGQCTHLGAVGTGLFSAESCNFGAETCYGHTLDMRCTATADAQCGCFVDDEQIGVCALGADLAPQACGGFEVFTGCCTDLFVDAILAP